MNRWGIPQWLEQEVRERDALCVYCRVPLREAPSLSRESRRVLATWEHIINDATIVTRDNIARCCAPCNSSKGSRQLSDWLESDYCKRRGISAETVAEVVKRALLLAYERS